MSSSQKKITGHTKKQENIAHSQEKKYLTEIIHKEAHTLDILDEDFKLTVLNMFKELKDTMGKELRGISKMMYEQNETINREVQIIKNETKILEPKMQ